MKRSPRWLVVAILSICGLAWADDAPRPKEPTVPATYAIDIYYRIDAHRNERARQFRTLQRELKALGFVRDVQDEERGEDLIEIQNVNVRRMRGMIPSANARKVTDIAGVRTILLRPATAALPAPDQPVRVHLELDSGLGPRSQRDLTSELGRVLRSLGFGEAIGYDSRQYTRLVGRLPVNRLEALLTDIRRNSVSWPLLPRQLLNEMAQYPNGPSVRQASLLDWYADPEGKKLVMAMLEKWVVTPAAVQFLGRFPRQVIQNDDTYRNLQTARTEKKPMPADTIPNLIATLRANEALQELLLTQVQQNPAGASFLDDLMSEVLKNKSAPALVDSLLSRLEGKPTAAALPQLFRSLAVVRVIEVRPDYKLPELRLPTRTVPELEQKLTLTLQELIKDDAKAARPRALELILSTSPADGEREWDELLRRVAPSVVVEGRVGPVVSIRVKPAELRNLATLGIVSTIREPVPATSAVLTLSDEQGDPGAALRSVGLDKVHHAGARGKKVRVAVIHNDFRGWQALVGKQLPAATQFIDLTVERNSQLQPAPEAADATGAGVLMARAVVAAAPDCELVLVRVDPTTPYLMNLAQRRMNGENHISESLSSRGREIGAKRTALEKKRTALQAERRRVFALFADDRKQPEDPKKEKDQQDPQRLKQLALEEYRRQEDNFKAEELAFVALERSYLRYHEELKSLKDVRVAVCGLSWVTGHPVDGSGAIARFLDDTPFGPTLWFQAAGNSRSQAWTDLFRDIDGDGVMEFAEAQSTLPTDSWNRELNFMGWQPVKGERTRLLPAGTRVRVTLQWQEAHDADFSSKGEDPFRKPLANLSLLVLQQLDPEGKQRPADDLLLIEEAAGMPQRLANKPSVSTYEHVVEFTTGTAARYAVRVEGAAPDGTEPPGTPRLPSVRTGAEIRPRIFVETLSGDGKVVLESYFTDQATAGTPADSLRANIVGAVDATGKDQPYSTIGSGLGTELAPRPDLRLPDRLGLDGMKNVGGSGISAGFAAGYAASLLSKGVVPEDVLRDMRERLRKGQ